MRVRHPQYGTGTVKAIAEHTADVRFDEGLRTLDPQGSGLEPAEPQASLTGLDQPLGTVLRDFAQELAMAMGLDRPDAVAEELGARWQRGKCVLHPSDPTLQTKEVPLELFFHKVVMMRNNLRVLEQKINAHKDLSDAEKFDLQQYITRCYGSMTTFNVLFRHKDGQFTTKGE